MLDSFGRHLPFRGRLEGDSGGQMTNSPDVSGQYLRVEQIAALLHKTPRWLRGFLRAHPDCYSLAGRTMLVSEADLAKIKNILKENAACLSSSSLPGKARRRIIGSVGRTSESTLTAARNLARELSRAR